MSSSVNDFIETASGNKTRKKGKTLQIRMFISLLPRTPIMESTWSLDRLNIALTIFFNKHALPISTELSLRCAKYGGKKAI